MSPATKLIAVLMAAALVVTGCAGPLNPNPDKPVDQAMIDKAMQTPTTLTLWSWVPGIEAEVKLFEQKYPNIHVDLVNVGGGSTEYVKLRAVIQAKRGGPDVAQVEYQMLPSFRITGGIANLEPYGARELKKDYVPWVWNQVADDTGVWAVPTDSGPTGNLYRKDILDKAGITTPPRTWEEYTAAANAVRQKVPSSYISNLAPNDPGQFVSFFWQAGARPFDYDGDRTVTINLHSPEVKRVTAYWQQMIKSGLVSTDTDFTDGFYQGLSNGRYAGWLTAAWAPVFLQGTVANTKGKWRAAPMPQWSATDNVAGNWGGSTNVVISFSEHRIAAYELAKFLNHDQQSALKMATEQFQFPTTEQTLNDPAWLDQKSEFYGGQQVNKEFAHISETVNPDFGWLPFMDYAYSNYNQTLGKAIAGHADLDAGLAAWESQLVSYAQEQGFTVKQED